MMSDFRTARVLALLPLAVAGAIAAAPVQASPATTSLHRAMRAKILKDASDRSHVDFQSTYVNRLSSRLRGISGRGIFERGHKPPQRFRYHGIIDVRSGMASDLSYTILR